MVNKTEIRDWNIYKITSPSNRVYVGITCNLLNRLSMYRSKSKSRQTLIYNSIKKYGFDNHKFEIIDSFTGNKSMSNDKEMFWVRSFMSNKNKFPEQNGLNLTDGGEGVMGYKATPETVEKNRQSKLGKKASDSTKKKMSESRRGKKMNFTHMTPEFKQSLSNKFKGKSNLTEEGRQKLIESSKRMWVTRSRNISEDQKEKLRAARLGKKASPETRKKLSEARKGKKIKSGWTAEKREKMREIKLANPHKHTDEAKRKISEAAKGNKYNLGRKQSPEQIEKVRKRMLGNTINVGRKKSNQSIKYK